MRYKIKTDKNLIRTKGITMLLIALLCMIVTVGDVDAEENVTYSFGHFYYHSHEGYVSICGYLGRETEVMIPASISGKPVSEIESGTFEGCDTIEIITVPDTVVLVYDDSFTGAASLNKIISSTEGVVIKAEERVSVEYTSDSPGEQAESEIVTGNPDTEVSHFDTEIGTSSYEDNEEPEVELVASDGNSQPTTEKVEEVPHTLALRTETPEFPTAILISLVGVAFGVLIFACIRMAQRKKK